jgi:hypothetical protein
VLGTSDLIAQSKKDSVGSPSSGELWSHDIHLAIDFKFMFPIHHESIQPKTEGVDKAIILLASNSPYLQVRANLLQGEYLGLT